MSLNDPNKTAAYQPGRADGVDDAMTNPIGARLGDFEVVRELGRGGMGVDEGPRLAAGDFEAVTGT